MFHHFLILLIFFRPIALIENGITVVGILTNPDLAAKSISNIQEVLPLLEAIMQESGKLLIICDDIEGEALSTLILNKLRGVINVVAVKAPGYGDKRKQMLEDISILTGGEVITSF